MLGCVGFLCWVLSPEPSFLRAIAVRSASLAREVLLLFADKEEDRQRFRGSSSGGGRLELRLRDSLICLSFSVAFASMGDLFDANKQELCADLLAAW